MRKCLVAVVLVVGCAGGPAPAPTGAPAPVGAALHAKYVASFRTAWAALLPQLKPEFVEWGRSVDALVRDPKGPLEVRTETCRARAAFIRSHIPEIDSLVIAGSLDRLDRDGVCGIVDVAGGAKREAEAVLAGDASDVLLVWVVPEG